ncbi:MAG: nucleotidyltransferase domain-containing protein [Ignavibacteria bacterium]|nr:nucleotidyltransferase domain-containing protein [Ignavibacteria bacterium]
MTDKELKKLLLDLQEKLQLLLGEKLVKVILYGSYANETFDEESDIDIMVLTKLTEKEIKQIDERINELVVELSLQFELLVSIFLKSADQFYKFSDVIPFYKNVLEHGITLYE